MSESKDENKDGSGVGISDDQLPEDLVPSEDNPRAEGLPDGETVGDLLNDGKRAETAEGEQPKDDSDNDDNDDNDNDNADADDSDSDSDHENDS